MRVFIILSLSMGGPIADHTHTIFWRKKSWHFVLCIQYVMQYSCFLTRRQFGRKEGFPLQSKALSRIIRVIVSYWKGDMHKVTFKSLSFFKWLGKCRSATLVHTEQCDQCPPSRGRWILEAFSAADSDNGITLTEQCHFNQNNLHFYYIIGILGIWIVLFCADVMT